MVHPFWNAESWYSQFRAGYRPATKMRGYLHHLATLTAKGLISDTGISMAARSDPMRIVVSASDPIRPCNYKVAPEIKVLREGELRIRLFADPLGDGPLFTVLADCRAFFLDPAVVRNLLDRARVSSLGAVFTSEVVNGDVRIAGMLAAVPEMDGVMEDGVIEFPEVCVSGVQGVLKFPEQMGIVVVVNQR